MLLTEEEWKVLQSTDVNHGASLEGTELWYHAAYAWSHVAMAQWLRSVYSASHHEETLFIVAARDYIINVDNKDLRAVRDALLKIPNMNTTGRIPAVAMVHVGMKVRLTVTICPCEAPVDSIGVVKSVEMDPADRLRWQQSRAKAMFVLHAHPTLLIELEGSTRDTGLGPGVIAVDAVLTQVPFSVTVELAGHGDQSGAAEHSRANVLAPRALRSLQVRARRKGLPITIVTASTLYTLQGTTCEPGLIYHFKTPRRLSKALRWTSTYMALSRVRSLKDFRGIGINNEIRDLINDGPPSGPLTRFLTLFESKARDTEMLIADVMRELHWCD